MTSTTRPQEILLHNVVGDPVRNRLLAAFRAAAPEDSMSDIAESAGLDVDTALAVLGLLRAENTDSISEDGRPVLIPDTGPPRAKCGISHVVQLLQPCNHWL